MEKIKQLKELIDWIVCETNIRHTEQIADINDKAMKALDMCPEWISVSDRLPEDRLPYLVSFGNIVEIALFNPDTKQFRHSYGCQAEYWMELP